MSENTDRRLTDPVRLNPDDQASYVDPASEHPTTFAGEVRFQDLYGHMLLHRPEDLWVAPPGPIRGLQTKIRAELLRKRFSLDDADEWAYRKWTRHIAFVFGRRAYDDHDFVYAKVVEIALSYRDTGMPIDEAFVWAITPLNATHALHYRNQGWNPHSYRTLVEFCLDSPQSEREGAWIESPVVWWRALRYLRAGLTLNEALQQEDRRVQGDDVDLAIDVLLGLTQEGSK